MKIVFAILLGLLLLLQIKLWHGDGSITQVLALRKEVGAALIKVEKLKERNLTLEAEVQDLKHGLHALEERARTDLGMIRQGETFYQFSLNEK